MNDDTDRPPPARVFIREWMTAKQIPNQKSLAARMKRAEGTVSKKLGNPSLIDLQWLADFALAFGIDPVDLFRNPSESTSAAPEERRPRLAELMAVAAKLTDGEIGHLVAFFRERSAAPPGRLPPEDVAERSATSKSK